jgi:pyruvate formate lyase activating enzyme
MPDGAPGPATARAVPAHALRVGGFVPFTSTDYPDALAAVVFCQGCPWRCAYCHNPHLIAPRGDDERDFAEILDWLKSRRGLLDAVVFSGGEPTAQAEIVDAARAVRALGFAVGLHTGGAYPRRLARLLPEIDWIGLDVKAPQGHYAAVTGVRDSGAAALASLDLVRNAGCLYEVRTTVHPDITPADSLERLARELAVRRIERWVLQAFRPTGCTDATAVAASGTILDHALLARLSEHVPVIELRA